MTKTNLKKAYAGNECHYAGLSKRPVRIFNSYTFGTVFGSFKESEYKYGYGCNDNKYKSFLFNKRGIGICRENGYIFLGIRLFGIQTLLMVVDGLGIGKDACQAYHYLDDENEVIMLAEYTNRSNLDNEWKKWQDSYLVGDLVEMKELEEGDLDEVEKTNISKIFEKIMEKADGAFARRYNPEKVAADEPNLEKVRKILAA